MARKNMLVVQDRRAIHYHNYLPRPEPPKPERSRLEEAAHLVHEGKQFLHILVGVIVFLMFLAVTMHWR